jgi:pyridoxine 5-phosphate synthase
VPDGDGQLTSDHGFDFGQDLGDLAERIARLKALGCRVSLFVDGDADAGALPASQGVEQAARIGADRIELYTGPFAAALEAGESAQKAAASFAEVARRAQAAGLGVNAGHDLSQHNLRAFLDGVPQVLEVSIGHALVSEALYAGIEATVRAYTAIVAAG